MSENLVDLEKTTTVYDFDELSLQTDYPAREVRIAIGKLVGTIVDDVDTLEHINLGVGEMVKDVEVHGDTCDPRLVIVRREIGGLAIETVNKVKTHSEHNGFGRLILKTIFGSDYYTSKEDDTFRGYLFIREGLIVQLNPEIV